MDFENPGAVSPGVEEDSLVIKLKRPEVFFSAELGKSMNVLQ